MLKLKHTWKNASDPVISFFIKSLLLALALTPFSVNTSVFHPASPDYIQSRASSSKGSQIPLLWCCHQFITTIEEASSLLKTTNQH